VRAGSDAIPEKCNSMPEKEGAVLAMMVLTLVAQNKYSFQPKKKIRLQITYTVSCWAGDSYRTPH
jgi:hypothetical protein